MGTPEFAVPALEALIASRHSVVAVYTQPPRPAGRGNRYRRSPVYDVAERAGLEVRHPDHFRDPLEVEAFAALDLDVAVVAAYGLILPQAVLDAPRHGCLNIHASLLPRWRGASPLQQAIMAGDAESGVTIMAMVRQLDAGAMVLRRAVPITAETTYQSLHDQLATLGAALVVEAVEGHVSGRLVAQPQDETKVTYAAKVGRADGVIDWRHPAAAIERRIRALTPWPGCTLLAAGEVVKVTRAAVAEGVEVPAGTPPGTLLPALPQQDGPIVACGQGALRLLELQRAGKARVDGPAFLRGFGWAVGEAAELPGLGDPGAPD